MLHLDALRLAAGLAHLVPGAELHLGLADGDRMVVSGHPATSLTPCVFRRILVNAVRGRSGDHTLAGPRVTSCELAGSLEDLGGGVFGTRTLCGLEQRWIATTLPWRVAADLLETVAVDGLDHSAVHATVAPDEDLGVTSIALAVHDVSRGASLDALSTQIAASCLAEELMRSAIAIHLSSTPQELDR